MLQAEQFKLIQEWETEFTAQYGGVFGDSDANIPIVMGVISNNLNGELTKDNLTVAALSSINMLKWKVRPRDIGAESRKKAEAEAERNKKRLDAIKRQQAGFQPRNIETELDEKSEQQTSAYDVARLKAKKESDRRCQAEVDRIIQTHMVVVVGKISHSKTEEQRSQLRAICVKQSNGEIEWNATLAAVETKARQLAGL